jgi:hypothetical protein
VIGGDFFHFISLDNVAEIKLAVTPLHRNALLSHDRRDKLCGRDVKARIVNPVQSFGRDHDRSLGPITLGIHRRRIQRSAHDTRFQWRTMLDWYAFLGTTRDDRG